MAMPLTPEANRLRAVFHHVFLRPAYAALCSHLILLGISVATPTLTPTFGHAVSFSLFSRLLVLFSSHLAVGVSYYLRIVLSIGIPLTIL